MPGKKGRIQFRIAEQLQSGKGYDCQSGIMVDPFMSFGVIYP